MVDLPGGVWVFWDWSSMPQTCTGATRCPRLSHFLACCDRSRCRGSTNHSLCSQSDTLWSAWADCTLVVFTRALMELNCRTLIKPPSRHTEIKKMVLVSFGVCCWLPRQLLLLECHIRIVCIQYMVSVRSCLHFSWLWKHTYFSRRFRHILQRD